MSTPPEGDVPEAEGLDVSEVADDPQNAELVDEVADVIEAGEPLDSGAPQAPPPRKSGSVTIQGGEITADDRDFLQRVFSQVHETDWRAPPPPPPKNLQGLDKKMQGLRDRVRKLERDLARLGYIWSIKQKEVDAVDKIVATAEGKRQQAESRYHQLSEQVKKSAEQHQQLVAQLNDGLAKLTADKKQLEAQLAGTSQKLRDSEQQRTALLEEAKQKLGAAQQAFTQLRDQSGQRIQQLETQVRQRDDQMTTLQAELDQVNVAAGKLETSLEETRGQLERTRADLEARIEALKTDRGNVQQKLLEVERSVSERDGRLLAKDDELARQRKEHETQLGELGRRLDEGSAALRNAEAARDQAKEETRLVRGDVERLGKELSELQAKAAAGGGKA